MAKSKKWFCYIFLSINQKQWKIVNIGNTREKTNKHTVHIIIVNNCKRVKVYKINI